MPRFAPAPARLVQAFQRALMDFPMADQRKMFGYPSATIHGNMFTSLFGNKVIVRLGPDKAAEAPGAALFEPMPGRPMKGWVVIPPRVVKSPRELKAWLAKGYDYTRSLPAKASANRS